MMAEEQARYRARLEDAAADLRRRITAGEDAEQPVTPDRAIGRLTRVEAMQAQQMALALRRRHEQRLQRIERALGLIAQGAYGVCTRCGDDIAPARLDAAPDTFLCVACVEALRGR